MIFEVYIPRIINNFYIYSNILGIINYLWVGKRETYFQNTSPRSLLYFYSWFVSRTSWLFFFTKKKRQRKREKIPISSLNYFRSFSSVWPISSRISSETWIFRPDPEISALVIHEPTLLPLPLLYPVLAFREREKKKERKRGEGTKNREEKKKNRSSCDILADLYHVSLKNSRVSREFTSKVLFYSIYSFSFHSKLNNRMRKNSANCRIKKKHVIFLYRE